MYLTPPLRKFPLKFFNDSRAQTRAMHLPDGGNSLTICAFALIQFQGVTDRQTDRFVITTALCMHSMLTRDINESSKG